MKKDFYADFTILSQSLPLGNQEGEAYFVAINIVFSGTVLERDGVYTPSQRLMWRDVRFFA